MFGRFGLVGGEGIWGLTGGGTWVCVGCITGGAIVGGGGDTGGACGVTLPLNEPGLFCACLLSHHFLPINTTYMSATIEISPVDQRNTSPIPIVII